MAEALKARHPPGVVTFGNGYCHDHFHWIFAFVGRFKKVALPDMTARAATMRSTEETLQAPAKPSQEPTSAANQFLAASENLGTPAAEPRSPSEHRMKVPFVASTSGLTTQPLDDPAAEERRQRLIASKPRRDVFDTDEDFEEALGFWMGRYGWTAEEAVGVSSRPRLSKRRYCITHPDGSKSISGNLSAFCRDHGLANVSNLWMTAKSSRHHSYKGYSAAIMPDDEC